MRLLNLLTLGVLNIIVAAFYSTIACADVVHLLNGDRITGQIIEKDGAAVILEAQGIGRISIDRNVIDKALTDHEEGLLKDEEMKEELEKVKAILWSGKATGGFDRRRGNVNSTEILGELELIRKKDRGELKNKLRIFYSEEDRKMNAQKFFLLNRFDYRLGESKKWFGFLSSELDRDRFANIDYRWIPTTGAGYHFSETEDFKALAETGIGYSYTKFRDGTDAEGELTLTPRIYIEKGLFGSSKISEELKLYPLLTDLGEYRLISETVFTNPITDSVALKLQFIDEYNSMPGGTAKKNDVRLITSLEYSF